MASQSQTVAHAFPEQQKSRWLELDILRGFAAVMMVTNHLGVGVLRPEYTSSGWMGVWIFIGSFAPVMFFFVTGVGYGLQALQQRKKMRWSSVLNKFFILVLADLLMFWSRGRWWGMDFLGFIALSSLVLEVVRSSKSPVLLSSIGFVGISALRFLVGPVIHKFGLDQHSLLVGFTFGTLATPGVSYPLAPWLAYPFLGYLVGCAAVRYKAFVLERRWVTILGLLIASGVPAIVSLYLARTGAVFFRWGTVSLAFYIISFTVISVCLAIALIICSSENWAFLRSKLALPGINSLAIVPIHYFLIESMQLSGLKNLLPFEYVILAIIVTVLSFYFASLVSTVGNIVRQAKFKTITRSGLLSILIIATGATVALHQSHSTIALVFKTIAQLVLCLLFVLPTGLKSQSATVSHQT